MNFWQRQLRTLHLPALALLGVMFAMPLTAQKESQDAREILSRPEYAGYRIEDPQPADVDRTEGQDPNPSNHGGGQPSDGETSSGPRDGARHRRSVSPSGPSRRGAQDSDSGNADFGDGPSLDPAILQVVFWIVIGIAAVIALVFIVRAFLDRKPRKKKATQSAVESIPSPEEAEEAPADAPKGFPALEAELNAALKAGNYALAALLRYKLFWLTAGWQGAVNETEVKTWRDALRMVQVEETRRQIRRLLFLVESVRYGHHVPRAEEYQQWNSQLETIDAQAVLG